MNQRLYINTKRVTFILLAIFISTLFISNNDFANPIHSNAYAQDANPNIDPRAADILQNMSYFLGSKDQYTFKAEVMFDQLINSNRKIQYSAEEKVYLKKNGNLTIEYVSDLGGYKMWYEAGKLTMLELPTNLVATATLPATTDQALNKLEKQYNFTPALSDLMFINTFRVLTANVISGSYFGTSKVFGVRCDHLAFTQQNIDWQIWVETGKRQIPRKLVITYKDLPGAPQFIAILRDWVIDKPITSFAFQPDLPKTAQNVDITEILNKPRINLGSVRSSGSNF